MTTQRISITKPGEIGIIKDIDPALLPPNGWTDGRNIRFNGGEAYKILGQTQIQIPTLTDVKFITSATKWATALPTKIWVYAGLDHVYYSDNGTSDVKITRQNATPADVVYTGSATDRWQSCVNQNILVLNNGVDSPQALLPDATKLKNLRWDSGNTWNDVSWTTKVMRSHKNFLFALQVDKDDGYGMNPNSVVWSEPAEPWVEPTTWDVTDLSSITGQVELASTPGSIVDGLSLGDNFIIYKDTSIYNIAYTGGQYVWQVRDVSDTIGLFSQGTVVNVLGQHIFMSKDDILATDGYQFKSIVTDKVRNKIFTEIDSTLYSMTFAVANYGKTEVWFCYPTTGSSYINRAAIWNYKSNTWTFKDLPSVNFLNYGVIFNTATNVKWDDDDLTWESDSTIWDENDYSQVVHKLLGATDTSIKMFDAGYTNDSASYDSYLERTGLILGNSSTMKRITAIYPRVEGEVDIYVGQTMHQNDPYTWEGPFNIVPESDAQIRCRVTGRYHGIRFVFKGDYAHKILGYDIEYIDTGYGR